MVNTYNKKVLKLAVYAGEIMMKNGAEIYRVEDTIRRLCTSCGIKVTEVFSTPTGIFVSLDPGDDTHDTQTYIKRMRGTTTDLNKISQVNTFAREFTSDYISIDDAMETLREIDSQRQYPIKVRLLAAAGIAGCFSLIFGGTIYDALIAILAGGFSYAFSIFITQYSPNFFIHGFLCCAVAAIIAVIATSIVPQASYEPIIIGSLMVYVPGVAITNSIRDFLTGDTLSGLSRMTDAVIIAASLAAGAGIVIHIWHMLGGGI